MKPFVRAIIESIGLLVLYFIGLELLSRIQIMDLLMAPGGAGHLTKSGFALLFLLFRLFILTCLPGFVLARWYLLAESALHTPLPEPPIVPGASVS